MITHRILIVEDDIELRDTMHHFMTQSGYETFVSTSAEHALECIKTTQVDVVITDILLTGISGLELTDIIKKKYDIDVIVMTGQTWEYSYDEVIDKGASDFVCKPIRFEELRLRLKQVLTERQYRFERKKMLAELKKLSITDNLTALYNSRHFYKQLAVETNRAERYNHPLSLMLLDVDYFKNYNDTYGHLEGDKVLARIGSILKSCLRVNDTAYRYGGEEFTVILPVTDILSAKTVADRMRVAVQSQKYTPVPKSKVTVTISIGVVEYQPGEEVLAFVQRSDQAMYQSKERGRNRVTIPSPEKIK